MIKWILGAVLACGLLYAAADRVIETYQLQMKESGGTDKITIQPPSLGAPYTLTLPVNDGGANEFLQTDGSGVLSWAAAGGSGLSIGDTITSGTDGSVLFLGPSNVLAQDNSAFFWDTTNDRLSLGITNTFLNSNIDFQLSSNTANQILGLSQASTGGEGFDITFYKARGTVSSPSIIADSDFLGEILWMGYDGDEYTGGANISVAIQGTPGNNDVPAELQFYTTNDGSATRTKRLTITRSGQLIATNIHDNGGTGGTTLQAIASGTFTPTLTSVANIDSATANFAQWIRVGNVVSISGRVDLNATAAATLTEVAFSLPVTSNFTAGADCSGTASGVAAGAAEDMEGVMIANTSTDTCNIVYYPTGTGTIEIRYVMNYLIGP